VLMEFVRVSLAMCMYYRKALPVNDVHACHARLVMRLGPHAGLCTACVRRRNPNSVAGHRNDLNCRRIDMLYVHSVSCGSR
jgi:hypothetical protein